MGGRRAISFRSIIPLKTYLSFFWTSLKSHTSSSHLPLLFSELWLPFLVCEHNPRVQRTARTAPAAQHQPFFWAGKSSSGHSPSVHKKDWSEGEGQWNDMLQEYFFPYAPKITPHTRKRKEENLSWEQIQSITFPMQNWWVFYQDRDQCPREGWLAELPSPVRNRKWANRITVTFDKCHGAGKYSIQMTETKVRWWRFLSEQSQHEKSSSRVRVYCLQSLLDITSQDTYCFILYHIPYIYLSDKSEAKLKLKQKKTTAVVHIYWPVG